MGKGDPGGWGGWRAPSHFSAQPNTGMQGWLAPLRRGGLALLTHHVGLTYAGPPRPPRRGRPWKLLPGATQTSSNLVLAPSLPQGAYDLNFKGEGKEEGTGLVHWMSHPHHCPLSDVASDKPSAIKIEESASHLGRGEHSCIPLIF